MKSVSVISFLFVFLIHNLLHAQEYITPATALDAYLNNGDKTYEWQVRDSFQVEGVKGYNLNLTSQKWRAGPGVEPPSRDFRGRGGFAVCCPQGDARSR